jgi:hypothetical protein
MRAVAFGSINPTYQNIWHLSLCLEVPEYKCEILSLLRGNFSAGSEGLQLVHLTVKFGSSFFAKLQSKTAKAFCKVKRPRKSVAIVD